MSESIWSWFRNKLSSNKNVKKAAIETVGGSGFSCLKPGNFVTLKLRPDICQARLSTGTPTPRYDEYSLRRGYVLGLVKAVYQQPGMDWKYVELVGVIPETDTVGVRREYTVLEHEVELIYQVVNTGMIPK